MSLSCSVLNFDPDDINELTWYNWPSTNYNQLDPPSQTHRKAAVCCKYLNNFSLAIHFEDFIFKMTEHVHFCRNESGCQCVNQCCWKQYFIVPWYSPGSWSPILHPLTQWPLGDVVVNLKLMIFKLMSPMDVMSISTCKIALRWMP